MLKKMLIDASYSEETRVVVLNGNKVEEFDFESLNKKQLLRNIYLAKVTRIEPSLQASFIDYGGDRHGFLAFSDIHPDYYRIPENHKKLLKEKKRYTKAIAATNEAKSKDQSKIIETSTDIYPKNQSDDIVDLSEADSGLVEVPENNDNSAADAAVVEINRLKLQQRRYKIQDVITLGQILLVQVVKEERGNKGAALTTYLSLAGRYCVLMPNTTRNGGISRKITSMTDRKRLTAIINKIDIPEGFGLIIRTAGAKRSKTHIEHDYKYLLRQWNRIRSLTLQSYAPSQIYIEGSLIKRSIRDIYNRHIEEILIEGEQGYEEAQNYMKMLMPTHLKRVKHYTDTIPLFSRYHIETYLSRMFNPVVQLKSGGYIVINITEALVAIDVNSGRATKEVSIEKTALNTNLEAAEEVAYQAKLRDLAGLIVIDFIDMEQPKNNSAVEKRLNKCLKSDRARTQTKKISTFGLLEMSRQRLRSGMLEIITTPCPHCNGTGSIRSINNQALEILREIKQAARDNIMEIVATTPVDIANYLLNMKRQYIMEIESYFNLSIRIEASVQMAYSNYELKKFKTTSRIADQSIDESATISLDKTIQNSLPKPKATKKPRKVRKHCNQNIESFNEINTQPKHIKDQKLQQEIKPLDSANKAQKKNNTVLDLAQVEHSSGVQIEQPQKPKKPGQSKPPMDKLTDIKTVTQMIEQPNHTAKNITELPLSNNINHLDYNCDMPITDVNPAKSTDEEKKQGWWLCS